MSLANDANSYRRFNYRIRESHGTELVQMLCLENEAVENGKDYLGDSFPPTRAINFLIAKGYVYAAGKDKQGRDCYRLTNAGINLALIQADDEATMSRIQPQHRKYAVHPDTLLLQKLQRESLAKSRAAAKQRKGKS